MNITPVLLLTGYLGSGKTTLVNKILANKKGIKFAVIVNDIGEVNIDASLIEKGGVVNEKDDSLVALQNGCICCTLKMNLVEQIRDIMAMKRFDYIVIEASGICEPEPIARTICSIPSMGPGYTKFGIASLDCIVTVVDALRMKDEFGCAKNLLGGTIAEDDIENLVIQQIEFCNIILLNKASEVTKEELGTIRQIVRTIQPKAKIIECDWGETDLENILYTELFDYESVSTSAAWIHALEDEAPAEEHEHHHHHHEHNDEEGEVEEYGISTFVYYRRKPLNINKFDSFLAKHWPKGIIRTKGICYFSDQIDQCYLFEQAGSQVSLKEIGQWYATMPHDELMEKLEEEPLLARDWDPVYGDRMQKIVFIGQHLNKKEIFEALDFCLQD
ncbi:MAG: GTP-binding protein [Bacteroidales bacterium]|nr:GTP-binding protein [Candidatus Egerieousia equi]